MRISCLFLHALRAALALVSVWGRLDPNVFPEESGLLLRILIEESSLSARNQAVVLISLAFGLSW
jgi:hypothetical protein